MKYGEFVNRENLIEKEFIVKVAFPKSIPNAVTGMSIYNAITGGTNYIECEVREINNDKKLKIFWRLLSTPKLDPCKGG